MQYVDLPDPSPGADQAVVDIQAVGVNFTDIYSRMGVNPPGLPWVARVLRGRAWCAKSVPESPTSLPGIRSPIAATPVPTRSRPWFRPGG